MEDKSRYVLTSRGFARLGEEGKLYDERTFGGMPVHQRALMREGDQVTMSYDEVHTLRLGLGAWLRNSYDSCANQHGWLQAQVMFGGEGFLSFLENATGCALPVSVEGVKEATAYLTNFGLDSVEQALFLTIVFNQPVMVP